MKIPSRLVQIKREETMAQKDQEAAHEKLDLKYYHDLNYLEVYKRWLLNYHKVCW